MTSRLFPVLVAFAVAVAVTPFLCRLSYRYAWLDQPNERSSHDQPTPRTGGLAILIGLATALSMFVSWNGELIAFALCVSAMALLGFLDDLVSLKATNKLVAQVGVATMALAFVVEPIHDLGLSAAMELPTWVGVALSLFWIVGVTNGYNFMDGVNGIASIEAIVCGGAYASLFYARGDESAAVICLGLAGGSAGFLVFNAAGSIFMGDVGSATIGFLLAVLVLRLTDQGVPLVVALLPLLPFLVDTSLTLARRARLREPLFSAHRTHAYQRLTDFGWSHMKVASAYALGASVCAAVSVLWNTISQSALVSTVSVLVAAQVLIWLGIEWRATRTPSRR